MSTQTATTLTPQQTAQVPTPAVPRKRVYVGQLPPDTTRLQLEELCSQYGRVVSVDLRKRYGLVTFDTEEDAEFAIYRLNGRSWRSTLLVASWPTEKQLTPKQAPQKVVRKENDEKAKRVKKPELSLKYLTPKNPPTPTNGTPVSSPAPVRPKPAEPAVQQPKQTQSEQPTQEVSQVQGEGQRRGNGRGGRGRGGNRNNNNGDNGEPRSNGGQNRQRGERGRGRGRGRGGRRPEAANDTGSDNTSWTASSTSTPPAVPAGNAATAGNASTAPAPVSTEASSPAANAPRNSTGAEANAGRGGRRNRNRNNRSQPAATPASSPVAPPSTPAAATPAAATPAAPATSAVPAGGIVGGVPKQTSAPAAAASAAPTPAPASGGTRRGRGPRGPKGPGVHAGGALFEVLVKNVDTGDVTMKLVMSDSEVKKFIQPLAATTQAKESD